MQLARELKFCMKVWEGGTSGRFCLFLEILKISKFLAKNVQKCEVFRLLRGQSDVTKIARGTKFCTLIKKGLSLVP